jgi:hypothetical protein
VKPRQVFLYGICSLCLFGGCPSNTPNGTDPNDSSVVATSPGDTGSNQPSDGASSGTSAGGGTGNSPSSGDGSQNFSGCQFDLQGFWRELGGSETRYVAIDHVGSAVVSTFLQPAVCDHRDGTGTSSTTEDDWIGDIADCEITGTIQLCQYGCADQCTNGWVDSQSFTATVSGDGQRITGQWVSGDGNTGDVTLERMSCQPRLPDEFGLRDSGDIRWVRDEVTVQTPPDPNVGLDIVFRPSGGATLPAATPFDAGFDGAVASVSPADQANRTSQVIVELRDGTEVTYDFKGQILVNVGDNVHADTPIGEIQAGDSSGLLISPTDRHGSPANVDCIDVGAFVNP